MVLAVPGILCLGACAPLISQQEAANYGPLTLEGQAGMDLISVPQSDPNRRRTPPQLRAELDAIVDLCNRPGALSADYYNSAKRRYEYLFDELRGMRASRDDLRERLGRNDPSLDREETIAELAELDAAIEGAVFPTQLECPSPAALRSAAASTSDVDPADYKFQLEAAQSFNRTFFGDSNSGIGFNSDGTSETFAGTAPDEVRSWGGRVRIEAAIANRTSLFFQGAYSAGDAENSFQSPAGDGISSGFPYDDRSPSGSTGLNIGDRMLWGRNELDFDLYELKFGVQKSLSSPQDSTQLTAFGFLNGIFSRRDYYSEANASVFGQSLSQIRDQDINDDYYGLGGGLSVHSRIDPSLAAGLTAGGAVYYAESKLDALAMVNCPLCPAADQNFSIATNEKSSGAAFGLFFGADLSYRLFEDLFLTVHANYRYLDRVGMIFNPSSGNQVLAGERTSLRQGDAHQVVVGAGIRTGF
ncbi:MAG: hypothetical protein AAGE37_10840 [Pseudomonadota bacterium]